MKNKIKQQLTKMPVLKAILIMAFPIIMANLFQAMYQLTDSFWVGRIGGVALAAVSICTPIIFLAVSLGIGLAMAGSTFVAQYYGAKNHKMVDHSASQTILMVFIVSIIISILGYIFSPNILKFMGAKPEFYDLSLSFLRISFIALTSNFSFFIFQSIMRGIGKPSIPVYIVIITVLINFVLDPLFIFGYKSFPAMGSSGAAFATLITQTIAATIGFFILFTGRQGIHLKLSNFKPDFKFIKKAFLLGVPSSIEQSSRNLSMVVLVSLIASFGTNAIASYGAGGNLIQIAMLIGIGLAVANGTLVGQNIGAKNMPQAVNVSLLGAALSFIVLSVFGLLALIFSKQFISIFVPNDLEVINGASTFVKFVSIGFGFIGVQMAMGNVFLAAGKSATTMAITVTSQWLFQLPLAYVLSKYTSLGINGLWLAFPISSILTALVTFYIYRTGSWQKKSLIDSNDSSIKVSEEVLVEEGVH